MDEHIPGWWSSYNKLKHDVRGINEYATLKHAVLSIAAAYIMINRIYGDGVISGVLYKPELADDPSIYIIQQTIPVSRLFIEETHKVRIKI